MVSRFERARSGDPEATNSIVAALRPRLTRMALYYARCSGEDADDLLQEAWVGLLEALPELDTGIGSPDQYLIQRARWRLLDAVKRARVRRCLPLDEIATDGGTRLALDTALSTLCLWEFVQQLRATQRAVLACLLAGLTWRETGAALGFSSANVAYHVRGIRQKYAAWQREAVI